MSRIATGNEIVVKPRNNVYTVLVIVAALVNILAFVILCLRFTTVFGKDANLFGQ